jgi:hypothetical protein
MGQHTLGKVLKGVYAALVAGLGGMSSVLVGSAGFGQVTMGQWVSVTLSAVVAFGGVYGLAGWSGPKGNGTP